MCKQQGLLWLPVDVDSWCCPLKQTWLHACLPSKKLYFLTPSPGKFQHSIEAHVSEPTWDMGKCNREDLATWSLVSGYRTEHILPMTSVGDQEMIPPFLGFELCHSGIFDTLFPFNSSHSLIAVALCYHGLFSIVLASLPPFPLWIPASVWDLLYPPFLTLCLSKSCLSFGTFPFSLIISHLSLPSPDCYQASSPTAVGHWLLDVIAVLEADLQFLERSPIPVMV